MTATTNSGSSSSSGSNFSNAGSNNTTGNNASTAAKKKTAEKTADSGDNLPFGGDWFVCHVARVLRSYSHSSFELAGNGAWSPAFNNWLLSWHGAAVIHTDQ
jgi:hypothetical protein